jgi:hypothetical protein
MNNICSTHDEIIRKSSEILNLHRRINNEDCEDLMSRLEDALSLASDIYDLANDAKKCGQRMEDRLKDYRSSIESLGFTRNEKK